jgi:hypothetical protein
MESCEESYGDLRRQAKEACREWNFEIFRSLVKILEICGDLWRELWRYNVSGERSLLGMKFSIFGRFQKTLFYCNCVEFEKNPRFKNPRILKSIWHSYFRKLNITIKFDRRAEGPTSRWFCLLKLDEF